MIFVFDLQKILQNTQIQLFSPYKKDIYPYSGYIKRGLLATVNTDNRLVSNTSITDEILFLQNKNMINDAEILRGIKNAIEVSFASDDIKDMLLKELGKQVLL